MLKSPVTEQCNNAGLSGCPELVDGMLEYVGGDRDAAAERLKRAAAANSPEKLREFASAAKLAAQIPGAASVAEPLSAVLDQLVQWGEAADDGARAASADSAKSGPQSQRRAEASQAALDDARLVVATENPALDDPAFVDSASFCKSWSPLGAADAQEPRPCVAVRTFVGPVVVTDVHSAGACADDLFVVAGSLKSPAWVLAAGERFEIHGARYVVHESERLSVVARSRTGTALERSSACTVTWAGYKPE